MTYNLSNTGLRVSVVGMGCDGPSRFNRRAGKSTDHAVQMVRKALDLGDLAETMRAGVEASLKRLCAACVDLFRLHGVGDERYEFAASVMAPS